MKQHSSAHAARLVGSYVLRAGTGLSLLGVLALGACSDLDHGGGIMGPDITPRFTLTTPSHTYTTDADFSEGTLVNLNFNAPGSNQLQLNPGGGTFPFIWVSLSQRCTIAKVNTATGAILGEYRTVADGRYCQESSRTTVGVDGSVWVGHRGPGGVTHVGLAELNQCVDRNGNGVIDTSTGYGDVMPWPGSTSDVTAAQDECILHHVDTDALGFGDSRHLSIDENNKLWIGSFSPKRFVSVDAVTGIPGTPKTGFACGGYGGFIDRNGVIWSANGGGTGLLRWDPNAPDLPNLNPRCISVPVYGLAVDQNGWVWANEFGIQIRKISPDGNTILGPFPNGMAGSSNHSQGLAVDGNGDVWISSGLYCSGNCPIGHLKNDGTMVGLVPNTGANGSTGISIDANGYVWSVNRSTHNATRINPNAGPLGLDGLTPVGAVDLTVSFPATAGRPLPYPYNYSDMTGAQLFGSTTPQGSWTVIQDAGDAGHTWDPISWNNESEGFVPPGGSIKVEARAATSAAALGAEMYGEVGNGEPHGLVGQFIQVRVTLRAAPDGTSPILSDLSIGGAGGGAEGCSAVYWRNQPHRWVGVSTVDFFDPVFGVNLFSPVVPLGWVIRSGGTGTQAFGREATAALLNAYARETGSAGQFVAYRYSVAEVMAMVQGMDPKTMNTLRDILKEENEKHCPLSEGTPRRR
jgi:hypothetical protein